MSVLTTFALMTAAFAKKIGELAPRPAEVEITTLQASVDDLNSRLTNLEHDLAVVRLECDHWRALYEETPARRAEREAQLIAQAQMQRLMAQAQQQHAHAQQNLAAQNFYQEGIPQMVGLQSPLACLGQMNQAQALVQVMDDAFCNCVPARHDMFLGAIRRNLF